MKIFIMLFIVFIFLLVTTSCSIPGYKTKPERLTLGFPIWFGGPSMTWTFEENVSE